MAAMAAMPAAIILSAMAAMLNEGLFCCLAIPSKITQFTWKLDEQERRDAYKERVATQAAVPSFRRIPNHRGLISHVNGSILIILLRW